ncbi:hypothetical protein [Tunturiibacter gelidiferens]|uniref:hypothetical protein n=1 Tax=Tunturiibacter gelidiferens TaxID=3069689 RepID=UPI003D9B7906
MAEELQHGGAGIHCIGVEGGVLLEEFGQETAVSVAEDEGLFLFQEMGKEVKAAVFEGAAEG